MDANLLTQECRSKNEQGQSREQIVEFLHRCGLTITESIKIVREVFGVSLGEAKEIVSRHPVWSSVVEAARPLHDCMEQAATETDGQH